MKQCTLPIGCHGLAIVLTTVIMAGITSCGNDGATLQLSRAEYARVDTIYLAQVDSLNALTDSICSELKATKLQFTVDSIIEVRKKEAELIKSRGRQPSKQ